jgi:hypothetical protein
VIVNAMAIVRLMKTIMMAKLNRISGWISMRDTKTFNDQLDEIIKYCREEVEWAKESNVSYSVCWHYSHEKILKMLQNLEVN